MRWDTRELTTDRRRLDVRQLARGGHLKRHGERLAWRWSDGGWVDIYVKPDQVVISYRWRVPPGEWKDAAEVVYLEWTACNYGGRRAWWRCPRCGRRCAILYGAARFVCRRCADLAYPSQNESPQDRALRRANKIRRRLGGQGGMLNTFPDKPKGMHWRTYSGLYLDAREAEEEALIHLMGYLERADKQVAPMISGELRRPFSRE